MSRVQHSSLKQLFFTEAASRSQTLLKSFNRFKTSGEDKETVARTLHTLKGSARMVGFTDIASEIHALEDLLEDLEHTNKEGMRAAEQSLTALLEQLSSTSVDEDVKETSPKGGVSSPLAQDLLSSVVRMESLLESVSQRSCDGPDRDQRIHLELSVESELKRLSKHALELAFAPPSELFVGLEELVELVAESEEKLATLVCRAEVEHLLREYIPDLRAVLVHMVTNCVIHGLEKPQERALAGKPEVGRVEIVVSQSADSLSIEICDDGEGIDLEALREKFSGGPSERPWDELSSTERFDLLFLGGTSLVEEVTLNAGRGVGLASVRGVVDRLRGSVNFVPAELGSRARLSIPSPFYLADCLEIRSDGHLFSVITSSVERIEVTEGRPEPSLSQLIGMPESERGRGGFSLVVADDSSGKRVSVDRCSGLRGRVIYPLPKVDGMPDSVVGLSDSGRVKQLVIDLRRLTDTRNIPRRALTHELEVREPKLLVVDDSATTRSILSDVLTRAGYRVVEANDGVEALERLADEGFALVVSDLEMPNLDGLELLAVLRDVESPHASLPFVLFTSRDDSASFQRALLLGADRCIGKSDFQEPRFLALVRELLDAD